MKSILQIIFAAAGTFGFCLVFNIDKKHAIITAIGGGVCWSAYLLLRFFGLSVFISTFASAAVVGIMGEVVSLIFQIPSSVFDVPACVPLIPGSNLYYAIASIISQDWNVWKENTVLLALYAIGIASGLAVVIEMRHILLNIIRTISDHSHNKRNNLSI